MTDKDELINQLIAENCKLRELAASAILLYEREHKRLEEITELAKKLAEIPMGKPYSSPYITGT